MRLDHMLYVLALIFFLITVVSFTLPDTERNYWIFATAVLGLFSLGLGYTQRPKVKTAAVEAPAAPLTTATTPVVTQTTEISATIPKEETTEAVMGTPMSAPTIDLTSVKGIGEKRAAQLNALGVNSVEDLAKASAEDLATKLKISPKITIKWIEKSKELSK
jgi:predicted flap endonuclease-1-like 5' DNA nuclease